MIMGMFIYTPVKGEGLEGPASSVEIQSLFTMLTILFKLMLYMWLVTTPPCPSPPNSTALSLSTLVMEKCEQGGGLVPLTMGEDHVPE